MAVEIIQPRRKWTLKPTGLTKGITQRVRAWKMLLEYGVCWSCVHVCLQPLVPLEKCDLFFALLQELSCLQVRPVCPDILDACSATNERENFMKFRNIHNSNFSAPIQVAKFENLPSGCNFFRFLFALKLILINF